MNINKLDQNFLKTLTILYVEDDDDTRAQFSEFLQRPIGTLITAVNGTEGLQAFIDHSPDIIVTDILMPVMDGLTMSEAIRGIAPSVPIVVITAFEQTDYLIKAISIGIDKYVTKPVNSFQLFECLLECAHRLRAEQQLKLQHKRDIQDVWSRHNKIIATLAGGIAHDYNNMMHAVLGCASLVGTGDGSRDSKYLATIEQYYEESKKLARTLILIGMGTDENMQRGELMSHVLHVTRNALFNTDIDLILDYAEEIPEINFCSYQMELVFSNLVTNAVEAMLEGGTLRLSARTIVLTEDDSQPLEPGKYLQISLVDSGSGIAPKILPHIFDPYFSTKERGAQKGMGLSLALCHTIILRHGGIITAESTPEAGSRFLIWLPLAE
jgi:signal transduction histidine kinase